MKEDFFEETWRWFGPNDPISLKEIKQTGATGIVTALHQIPIGEIWPLEEIVKRKKLIESDGLTWSVTESVPVHEDIKRQSGQYRKYIENYKDTLRNLGRSGVNILCYNFMPVLDWLRTDLEVVFSDGSLASRFKRRALTAFDLFILKRAGAEGDYSEGDIEEGKRFYESMTQQQKEKILNTVLLGLPGSFESYTLDRFKDALHKYDDLKETDIRENLRYFIKEITPAAEEAGVYMGIHPDDPPFKMFGLPRVVSKKEDLERLLAAADSPHNGLTFCVGSLAASPDNDVVEMSNAFAKRINFIHLRNVKRDGKGGFVEDNHLDGDVDMYGVMKPLIMEQKRRNEKGLKNSSMPMRPDHGHLMIPDVSRKGVYPGYSFLGRMRGLAELRGVEMGIRRSLVV